MANLSMGSEWRETWEKKRKLIKRISGDEELVPSKCDRLPVEKGDLLLFETWGGGGWGNPLDRAEDKILLDVKRVGYCGGSKTIWLGNRSRWKDKPRGTKELRASMRESCEKLELFDKGGDLASIKKRSLEETGFEPPKDPSTR